MDARIVAGAVSVGAALTLTLTGSTAFAGEPDHPVSADGAFAAAGSATDAFTYDQALVPAGATASVHATYTGDGRTVVTLHVRGLLPNRDYGAHAHRNACAASPAAAGGHYQNVQDPVQPSTDPAFANPSNEIWLDLMT